MMWCILPHCLAIIDRPASICRPGAWKFTYCDHRAPTTYTSRTSRLFWNACTLNPGPGSCCSLFQMQWLWCESSTLPSGHTARRAEPTSQRLIVARTRILAPERLRHSSASWSFSFSRPWTGQQHSTLRLNDQSSKVLILCSIFRTTNFIGGLSRNQSNANYWSRQ